MISIALCVVLCLVHQQKVYILENVYTHAYYTCSIIIVGVFNDVKFNDLPIKN